jgi:hypothetical protein
MKKIVFYLASTALIISNIIVHVGLAGLLATGVYMLNSFLGLAANAKDWQYGLTGILYLVCNGPFVVMQVKDMIGKLSVLFDWM